MPQSLARLGRGKLCFLLFEAQRYVILEVCRTHVCRIVLQAWSCLFALRLHVQVWTLRLSRACYCSWCYSSWPQAVCWNNQASGVVGLGGSLGAELANITRYSLASRTPLAAVARHFQSLAAVCHLGPCWLFPWATWQCWHRVSSWWPCMLL